MSREGRGLLIAFAVLGAVFAAGVLQLFLLRFEGGDVYPAYSSLRSDPRGSKALYQSLESLPGLDVRRNYRSTAMLDDEGGAALFFLGIPRGRLARFERRLAEEFEEIADSGGRVFISLVPESRVPKKAKEKKAEAKKIQTEEGAADETTPIAEDWDELEHDGSGVRKVFIDLGKRWGFDLRNVKFDGKPERVVATWFDQDPRVSLPVSIRWLTTLVFSDLQVENRWRVVYSRDGHPVVMERPFGRGSLVLSTDSYFVSNEAMLRHRYPSLLAWLVGQQKAVVFDETHFGVRENIGIAALARRYRLHGLFFGLLLLALLHVWKNAAAFAPPPVSPRELADDANLVVQGKDASSGFINLLRRSVAPGNILAVCFQEWKKSLPRYLKDSKEKLDRMHGVIQREQLQKGRKRDPVAGYRTMIQIWMEGKQ